MKLKVEWYRVTGVLRVECFCSLLALTYDVFQAKQLRHPGREKLWATASAPTRASCLFCIAARNQFMKQSVLLQCNKMTLLFKP